MNSNCTFDQLNLCDWNTNEQPDFKIVQSNLSKTDYEIEISLLTEKDYQLISSNYFSSSANGACFQLDYHKSRDDLNKIKINIFGVDTNEYNETYSVFKKTLNLGRFHSYRLFFNIPSEMIFKINIQLNLEKPYSKESLKVYLDNLIFDGHNKCSSMKDSKNLEKVIADFTNQTRFFTSDVEVVDLFQKNVNTNQPSPQADVTYSSLFNVSTGEPMLNFTEFNIITVEKFVNETQNTQKNLTITYLTTEISNTTSFWFRENLTESSLEAFTEPSQSNENITLSNFIFLRAGLDNKTTEFPSFETENTSSTDLTSEDASTTGLTSELNTVLTVLTTNISNDVTSNQSTKQSLTQNTESTDIITSTGTSNLFASETTNQPTSQDSLTEITGKMLLKNRNFFSTLSGTDKASIFSTYDTTTESFEVQTTNMNAKNFYTQISLPKNLNRTISTNLANSTFQLRIVSPTPLTIYDVINFSNANFFILFFLFSLSFLILITLLIKVSIIQCRYDTVELENKTKDIDYLSDSNESIITGIRYFSEESLIIDYNRNELFRAFRLFKISGDFKKSIRVFNLEDETIENTYL